MAYEDHLSGQCVHCGGDIFNSECTVCAREVQRYFDKYANDVVPDQVLTQLAEMEKDTSKEEIVFLFELVPVVRSYGTKFKLGKECKHCGAPVGSVDPDEAQWVEMVTCFDCHGMY